MGLLPSVRGANGYRDFAEDAVAQVARIRSLLGVGLNLDEARSLLPCFTASGELGGCDAVRLSLSEHIARVDEQIRSLHTVRQTLAATAASLT